VTVFLTNFEQTPERLPIGDSVDSGFETLDDVVNLMGEPVARGVRYVAYTDQYYSDYSITPEVKT
jgi:hypothetical protein